MATITIGGLANAAPVQDSYYFPVDTGSYTGHVTGSDLKAYLSTGTLSTINVTSGTFASINTGGINSGPITAGAVTATTIGATGLVSAGAGLTVTGNVAVTGVQTVTSPLWNKLTLATTGITAQGYVGSDTNGLYDSTNAVLNGGTTWNANDTTKKAFAYIQNLGTGRHEFRVAPTTALSPSISWSTPVTIDETGLQAAAIGSVTPGSGIFTTLTSTGATTLGTVTASAISNTPIGTYGQAPGNFTTVTATNFVGSAAGLTGSAPGITVGASGVLNYGGNVTQNTSGTLTSGLTMNGAYNNGYPTAYGNLLNLAGGGYGQLLIGWSGTSGAVADNYIRSLSSSAVGTNNWSAWAKILTDQNYRLYAPTLTGGGAFGTWGINILGTAASAATSSAVSISYNNTSNSTYQVLWGSGNNVYGTGGIYVNPSTSTLYATIFSGKATSAEYADLAENYESDEQYEYGTVLVFGDETEVTISTEANDRRVAGVVSKDPAYLMNQSLDGIPLALQGRVPCKVTGPVKRGDLMVTSDIPGVAMVNNNPGMGTVIGKALQNYSGDGVGIIEVVVGRV